MTREGVIRDMVGRKIEDFFAKTVIERGELLMSVQGLAKESTFHDVTFDVYRGEVLGFAGLIGARRTDVGLALFGVEPADGGEIVFEGKPQQHQVARAGVAARHRLRHRGPPQARPHHAACPSSSTSPCRPCAAT